MQICQRLSSCNCKDVVRNNLNVENPVAPPIEFNNGEDPGGIHAGHENTALSTILHMPITFSASFLNAPPASIMRKRGLSTGKSG